MLYLKRYFASQVNKIKIYTFALGGRKKHPIAICLMLITELVCVVTLMRESVAELRIFGMTIAQCISKVTHIYVGSAVTQSHVADFDF